MLFHSDASPELTEPILDGVHFGANETAFKDFIANASAGSEVHAFIGYAGWGPGQLEDEIAVGGWHVSPGEPDMVFSSEPDTVWGTMNRRGAGTWVRIYRHRSARFGLSM